MVFTRAGTHDVQNSRIYLLIFNSHLSTIITIEVMCSFLAGSTPSGIFVIAYSPINSSNVHYAVGERIGNQSQVFVDGLSGGVYNVVVYDREEDQLPEVWPAEHHVLNAQELGT